MAMYYTTELIEQILKNEKARELLGWMPPVYQNAYVFLHLLNVIGAELGEMQEWAESYREQVVPQTATWSLPYWEERYGITPNTVLTIEQRRAAIINKMVTRAPINPKKLEMIISNMTSSSTKISENTGKNHFTVICGELLTSQMIRIIKKEIDRAKPSHLIYAIIFEVHRNTLETQYEGAATAVYKKYTVKEGM